MHECPPLPYSRLRFPEFSHSAINIAVGAYIPCPRHHCVMGHQSLRHSELTRGTTHKAQIGADVASSLHPLSLGVSWSHYPVFFTR